MKKKILSVMLISIMILLPMINTVSYAVTTEVKQERVDASKNGEEGYITTTTVNGATYKDYKQGTYYWTSGAVKSSYSMMCLPGCSSSFGYVGCGPTATAIVLSAYGIKGGTAANSLPYQCGILENTSNIGTNNCNYIKKAFDKYGVPSTVYNKYSANAKTIINEALRNGKPIVANVSGTNGFYSPGGHYIAVLGYDANDNLIISNPCKPGIYGSTGNTPVKLDTFFNLYLGGGSGQFLIPNDPPVKPISVESIKYSPENSTKTNVRTVTITASKDIASAIGSKSGKWQVSGNVAKFWYKNNVTDDIVTITDKAGNTVTKKVTVTNIDNEVNLKSVTYSTKKPTKGDVIVTITANEDIQEVSGSKKWTIKGNTATATYTQNTDKNGEKVTIKDSLGNSREETITITNIDKTAPKILETKYYNASTLNQKWVLITADEPIEVADLGKAWMYNEEPKIAQINYFKSEKDVDSSYRIIFIYDKNYDSDTIKISDEAGNTTSQTVKIDGIDDKGPELTVSYSPNGKTNKDVTVTVTSNEKIKLSNGDGWVLSSDKKKLTKEFSAQKYPAGQKETIQVKDKWGNITNKTINVKIDTQAPYILYPKEEFSSNDGSITATVILSETVSVVSGDGWASATYGGSNMISKTYTNVTDEEVETIKVKDEAGNTYSFSVSVKNDNNKLTAKILDKVQTNSINNLESNQIDKEILKIEIKQSPNKTIYYQGELLDLSGLSLNVIYTDGTNEEIKYSDKKDSIEVAKYGSSKSDKIMLTEAGNRQQIVVYYKGETTWFYIQVKEVKDLKAEKLEIKTAPNKLEYVVGENLNTDGLVLVEKYNDGTKREITKGFECTPTKLNTVGKQKILVTYEKLTTEYEVTVKAQVEKSVRSITIKQWQNKDKEYTQGETISAEGLVLTVRYTDGSEEEITKGFEIEPTVLNTVGTQEIKITYGGKTTSCEVIVKQKDNTENQDKEDKSIQEEKDKEDKSNQEEEDKEDKSTQEEREKEDKSNQEKDDKEDKSTQKEENKEDDKTVEEIEIIHLPNKLNYKIGEQLDLTGFIIKIRYSDNIEEVVKGEDFTIITPILEKEGKQEVKYTLGGKQVTFVINVEKTENTNKEDNTNKQENTNKEENGSKQENTNKEENTNKQENANNENNTNKEENNNTNKAENSNNVKNNDNEVNSVKSNNYKDSSTATSRLPQTGINQIFIIIMIIVCIIASGIIFIKYKRI